MNILVGWGLWVHEIIKDKDASLRTKCGIRLGLNQGHPYTETKAKADCKKCLGDRAGR